MAAEVVSGLQGYEKPVSLWALIEERVCHLQEQQEVKRILGESLVDQSLELCDEVCTLMSILEEMRGQQLPDRKSVLPEPPHLRERLVQEICFFVENVRDKAQDQGLDPEKLLSRHNSCIIDYATHRSRASSSMTDRHLTSPSTLNSPDISRERSVSEELQSISDKFNYLQLDEVVYNLRCHLEDEIANRLMDITFLQKCLDDEIQQQSNTQEVNRKEPTLADLKEERAALERELLAPLTPSVHKALFDPAIKHRKTVAANSGQSSQQTKAVNYSAPVKAIHNINDVVTIHPDVPHKLGYRSPSQVSLQDIAVMEKTSRRRTASPSRVKVVSVGNILSQEREESPCAFVPSPPPSFVQHQRPSSADKFRKRVLECRDVS